MSVTGNGSLHAFKVKGLDGNIDRRMGTEDAAKHLVINDIGLERGTHQAGLCAGRLRDDIRACLQRHGNRQALFIT